MSHTCQAIVFRCMDYRIKLTKLAELLAGIGYLEGSYDLVSLAGSARNILRSRNKTLFPVPGLNLLTGWIVNRFILLQIQLAVRLHKVSEIVILHHDNCGAYGLADPAQEEQTQTQDLRKIAEIITTKFPGLAVKSYILKGTASGNFSLLKV